MVNDILKNSLSKALELLTGRKPEINCITMNTNLNNEFGDNYLILNFQLGYIIVTPEFSSFWTDILLGGDGEVLCNFDEISINTTKEIFVNAINLFNHNVENFLKELNNNVEIVNKIQIKNDEYKKFICFLNYKNIQTKIGIIIKKEYLLEKSNVNKLTNKEVDSLLNIIDEMEKENEKEILNVLKFIKEKIENSTLTGNLKNPGVFIKLNDAKEIIDKVNKIVKK